MAAASADRNLLLGILAYQNAFVSKEQLLAAMQAWLHDKTKPLTEILRSFGALDDQRQALLDALVEQHLKQHADDPHASLRSLPASGTVLGDLQAFDDPDLQVSITHLSVIKDEVQMSATIRNPAVGAPSGARFLVLRPHAKGGLGEVYVALDTELNREVALKEIRDKLSDDDASRVRFLLEAQITGGLEHPSIVPVYGLGTYPDGRPFYAMRLIRGDSLMERIRRFHDGTMSEGDRTLELHNLVRRLVDVCNALQYAHDRGVFHRDIKPHNIMLGKYGETLIVDWGLAKATGSAHIDADTPPRHDIEPPLKPVSGGSSVETIAGATVGTPAYMSPEQAEGRLDLLGPACDIYSVGATLYTILTGVAPAQGKVIEILEKVRAGNIPRPRQIDSTIDRALEAICIKAMALRPGARYLSPRILADDLEHWLAGEPVSAWPEPLSVRMRRWMARHRTPVTALGSLLIAAIPLLVFVLWLTETAREDLQGAQEKTKKALNLAVEKEGLAEKRRAEAAKLAAENKKLAIDNAKGKHKAESLLLELTFEQAFSRPVSERSRSLLETAQLLGDPRLKANPLLENSFRLHLGSMIQEMPRLKQILWHGKANVRAAFSPDGKRALTSGSDDSACVWDIVTSKMLIAIPHQSKIVAIAFSPNGKAILTASGNHAQLWDSATGKPIGSRMEHGDTLTGAVFSPDGAMVLTGSRDKTARLWHAATGKPLRTPLTHDNAVIAVAFSPDSKLALTGSEDETARLWDSAKGKPIGQPMRHDSRVPVSVVAFSPNGKTLATASHDKVRLWTMTGDLIKPILQHAHPVNALAFSPDSKKLLTGGGSKSPLDEGEARLWLITEDKVVDRLLPHKNAVNAVAFGPDGNAVTGSNDRTARFWDAATGEAGPVLQHAGNVMSVGFSHDGTAVTTSLDGTARFWDLPARPVVLQHDYAIPALFSANGKYILTVSNGDARSWDGATGKPLDLALHQKTPIRAAALGPDGDTVLTGDADGTVRLWNVQTGKEIGSPLRHERDVWSVALAPDGKTALVGAWYVSPKDGRVRSAFLWDLAGGKQRKLQLPTRNVLAAQFSPDGKRILVGLEDGTARLLDVATGNPIGPDMEHQGQIGCIAFSPDGTVLLTGSIEGDKSACLWKADTCALIARLPHQGDVLAAAFSPDGTVIVTGCSEKTAHLWRANGKPIGSPLHHLSDVSAVAFSPDSKLVLTGSRDRTARLWEVATSKPLGPALRHDDEVTSVAFNPVGGSVLTVGSDRRARLWPVPVPIHGDADYILWNAEVITGLTLDHGNVLPLDPTAWEKLCLRLRK